jgi:hypothetical protein
MGKKRCQPVLTFKHMIQIIRLEAQHIEKPQNQIPNQSNIEG